MYVTHQPAPSDRDFEALMRKLPRRHLGAERPGIDRGLPRVTGLGSGT